MEGYVVIDRLTQGLAGGGLRFHHDVGLSELRRLARTMTHKWSLLGLPFGGCKLGIRGDASRPDKQHIIQGFAEEVKAFVRDRVFTGPDMGTSPPDLRPFFSSLGQDSYDVVAQKLQSAGYRSTPKDGFRSVMRKVQATVTGIGVARATEEAWKRIAGSLQGVRVSIQGYGSVGRAAAEELGRLGASVVCIADEEGCLWNPQGLDLSALRGPTPGILNRGDLPGRTESMSGTRWLQVDSDILVPAAIADAINWTNVQDVKAKLVVEAANIPVPEDVEAHLHRKEILVLPDFLVNAGLACAFGVLVTDLWERPNDVFEEVARRIVHSTSHVVDRALGQGHLPREAAVELSKSRQEG